MPFSFVMYVFLESGWGEIRTPGGLSPTAVFKTAALDHSATHPVVVQASRLHGKSSLPRRRPSVQARCGRLLFSPPRLPDYNGTMEVDNGALRTNPMNIEAYVSGPQLLRDAVAGMTPEQLAARPIPGKWSTHEVVCHVADFEIVYADRIKRVIAENEPTIFGANPDDFTARLAYHERNLQEELLLIELTRRHVARILRALKPEDFQRRGFHSESGPMTLSTLVERITGHIPLHIRFLEEKKRVLGVS